MTTTTQTIALGVGFTNACDLSCQHCYRATGEDRLRLADVLAAVDALPVRAVNFGTGENGLHPEFATLVRRLLARDVAVTMTTNGHSAAVLPDELLACFRDVELSIDHPTREEHDVARSAGNWDLIEAQMRRCRDLGVPTTIVAVLMRTNAHRMPELARLAASRGAALRINVYQAVNGDESAPSYEQFWDAWRALLGEADLLTCGEPIVRAVLGMPRPEGAGCGRGTVRLTPRGAVLPCVYGPDGGLDLADLQRRGVGILDDPSFRVLASVPTVCRSCPQVETCGGGCASRRALGGGLDRPDEYCPFVRGQVVDLPARHVTARAMPKAASACTTIVRGARSLTAPSE